MFSERVLNKFIQKKKEEGRVAGIKER